MVDLGLSDAGKEELALALLLWKDFKCQGVMSVEIGLQMFRLADTLGVRNELDNLLRKLPPFEIKPKS
jgi:hypothetical protein